MARTAAGFTGTVDQVDLSQMLDGVADHGVRGEYNDTSLSASKVTGLRTMLVQPGYVWVPGVLGRLDVAENATAAGALVGSNPRIDLLVARFSWGPKTFTLVMKQGTQSLTPEPPSLQQDPGDVFEVPLRQGMLTAASPSEYVLSSVKERRYWLEGGKFVLATATQLPGAKTGAMAYRPDTHQMLMNNGTAWDTFKAEADTGWEQIASPYGGFTGATWGRVKNGEATVIVAWTKGDTPITTPTNLTRSLPFAYWPSFDGVPDVFYAGAPKAPVAATLGSDGVLTMSSVVLNAGASLRGSLTYPVG